MVFSSRRWIPLVCLVLSGCGSAAGTRAAPETAGAGASNGASKEDRLAALLALKAQKEQEMKDAAAQKKQAEADEKGAGEKRRKEEAAQADRETMERIVAAAKDGKPIGLLSASEVLLGGKVASAAEQCGDMCPENVRANDRVWVANRWLDAPGRADFLTQLRAAAKDQKPLFKGNDPALVKLIQKSAKRGKASLRGTFDAASKTDVYPVIRAGYIESSFQPTVNGAGVKINDSRRIGIVVSYSDVCLQLRGTHVRSKLVEDRDEPEFVTTDWDSAAGLPMEWYSREIKASFVACQ